ncbi:gamma-glutamyltransferase [Paracoccus homiensis]|uniref:Gamma-glutamyltransferase 1 Threonine peptidase. MEROPS family T03 n=1 Tax=Paracoccus homiensis TaxID=364199 RepID=A0A1I0J9B8_9RHOB|nr:gamma-glutamyltransferase [Paracoccus homiensis]SEU06448.1 gamma-glutamyltransferase 1 Threonine peptidase. MEROPS family T03 [Paracoccus homiensis]
MSQALSPTMQVLRHVVETPFGVVAAQHRLAAEAGAEVLRAGGDAVDAAVACGFVLSVLEPWMSGPAGGGAAVHFRAETGEYHALDFGMKAPAGLRLDDFGLIGAGKAGDLFPWDRVVEDRNVIGARAVAVPAMVDGLGLAHERWGRMPWQALLSPAVDHARAGMPVDWYSSLIIGCAARDLAADPDAAALFLEDGTFPPAMSWAAQSAASLPFARMADSLDVIARDGPEAMHGGDLGAALARDVQDKGGYLTVEDLAANRARFHDPLRVPYRDARFHAVPGLTAGPTFARALEELSRLSPDLVGLAPAHARALLSAYDHRLTRMGADGEVSKAPGSTTHFAVVDQAGNMVSHTQTLLSLFGSRIVSPSTGFLLNNGIMWFDPVQGRPNSLGPGKRCLMNVCPVIGEMPDGGRVALGAAGGRKIVSAVTQLASLMVDRGLSLHQAFQTPRIDVSNARDVIADMALPQPILTELAQIAPTCVVQRSMLPYPFACPSGVSDRDGIRQGAVETFMPWAEAVGA